MKEVLNLLNKKKIAVLVSGGGTNFQSIIDNINSNKINGEICVVISSKQGVYALERAKNNNIPYEIIERKNFDSASDFEAAMIDVLEKYGAEIIVLAGYLSIIGEKLVAKYKNKIVNIHPSLIPSFCGKGYYGLKVHEKVLEYGVKVTGATVHFVDEGTDTGPIIFQRSLQINNDDSPEILQKRVMEIEHVILPLAVKYLCEDKIKVVGRQTFILD